MTAHEVAGHTKVCPKRGHGQYIDGVGACPVCAGVQRPCRIPRFVNYTQEIEAALRRRPKSGPVEP